MIEGRAQDGPTWAPGYRHLTARVPGVPFRSRVRLEDFLVEELALFEPAGQGEHLLLEVEKRGLSTPAAARRLARALGRPEGAVGFAGRKDARAVARQRFSVQGADPDRARGLELEGLRVLAVARHPRKLRPGQLAGNRFRLVLRDLERAHRPRVEATLAHLEREGLPNYFGEQRFGRHGWAHELGRLLLLGRDGDYLAALTSPDHGPGDPGSAELGRVLARGTWRERRGLVSLAPRLDPDLAALARQVARRPKDLGSAVRAVPKPTRLFHLSAWQARVFNRVLAERMAAGESLRLPAPGDVLASPRGGRATSVSAGPLDPDLVRRAAAFELVPTGPLPGARMVPPAGAAARREAAALGLEGVGPGDLVGLSGDPNPRGARPRGARPRGARPRGARRPLAVPVVDLELAFAGGGEVHLAFTLPRGVYATTLLEELAKRYG